MKTFEQEICRLVDALKRSSGDTSAFYSGANDSIEVSYDEPNNVEEKTFPSGRTILWVRDESEDFTVDTGRCHVMVDDYEFVNHWESGQWEVTRFPDFLDDDFVPENLLDSREIMSALTNHRGILCGKLDPAEAYQYLKEKWFTRLQIIHTIGVPDSWLPYWTDKEKMEEKKNIIAALRLGVYDVEYQEPDEVQVREKQGMPTELLITESPSSDDEEPGSTIVKAQGYTFSCWWTDGVWSVDDYPSDLCEGLFTDGEFSDLTDPEIQSTLEACKCIVSGAFESKAERAKAYCLIRGLDSDTTSCVFTS